MKTETVGYRHKCYRLETPWGTIFRISWTYDTKHGRIRYPRVIRRDTDEAGASAFCLKWGIQFPEKRTQ
jgi:hypothetical protein